MHSCNPMVGHAYGNFILTKLATSSPTGISLGLKETKKTNHNWRKAVYNWPLFEIKGENKK